MLKLALNFICKNESHVILNMLESARPIADLVVAVDTGSCDNTISLINEFGRKHTIPTYVYERPFDNFCNSRNYALSKLKDIVHQLGWDPEQTWGFFLDCDETLHISDSFQKNQLNNDVYGVTISGEEGSFTRQLFFHLSKQMWWEGPIHEFIAWEDPTVKWSIIKGLSIQYERKGASWKGDLEAKFLNYANLLSKYVTEGHETFRWVFYTGESINSAAEHCRDPQRKKELLSEARKYYERAQYLQAESTDEKIILQRRLGEIGLVLGGKWSEAKRYFLNGFSIDPRRAESIAAVIAYYMSNAQWHTAHLFSSIARKVYHTGNPLEQGVVQVDNTLYEWKLLLFYSICCYQTGRKYEAAFARSELKACIRQHPEYFSHRDLVYIHSNSPFYLAIRRWNPWTKKNLY
jgi:glycosyltransferase involved in cell wall biosynthesis